MRFQKGATIRDCYAPAMEITDPFEAGRYFQELVEFAMQNNPSLTVDAAEKVERSNLGYYSGYYDTATMRRVLELFGAVHPIFGAV